MKPINIKFYKTNDNALLPKKNFPTDAAFDLCYPKYDTILSILPGSRIIVETGLRCIIPSNYWLKFYERSGLAAKKGIKVFAGVIDSSYTGELKVILLNTSHEIQFIDPGQAICQFTVEKILPCEITEIDKDVFEKEAEKKDRKIAGFGSSDAVSK
jgi:dUTP pyrophosphatase